ncbi:uncharacterized protein BDV17DRAFT_58225 [Aspergillus undulatus]|uniref:uncharacterized protein n=1 Tax=Aspergillus undulatus TaxID=1810928 RepID=UPI003CCD827E
MRAALSTVTSPVNICQIQAGDDQPMVRHVAPRTCPLCYRASQLRNPRSQCLPDTMSTISSVLKVCLKQFNHLIGSESLSRFDEEISVRRWQDELGRLRVWAANIGAHQTGQSSLDYRLRDASNLQAETINILKSMQETLQDLHEVIDDSFASDSGEDNADGKMKAMLEAAGLDESSNTEVQQIYQNLVDVIDHLYRMSMAIRKPVRHDQLSGTRAIDATSFAPWATQHVSHKYPAANTALLHRLGNAMARQKAVLKYRERHRAKLTQGIDDYPETESNPSETLATESHKPGDQFHFLDSLSEAGSSTTSYADTLMDGRGGDGISVPPPPRESWDRKPFECPYCFIIITIKDRKDWARHVFRDLMPYICIYPDCPIPSRLYESRRQWQRHLCSEHSCTGPDYNDNSTCPLCSARIPQTGTFERHVGRHLEELALFVLPRTEEPDDEQGNDDVMETADSLDDEAGQSVSDGEQDDEMVQDMPKFRNQESDTQALPEAVHSTSDHKQTDRNISPNTAEDEIMSRLGRLTLGGNSKPNGTESESGNEREELPRLTTRITEPGSEEERGPDARDTPKEAVEPQSTAKWQTAGYRDSYISRGMWVCCMCGDGPKVFKTQPFCVLCHHSACSCCPEVK